MKATIIRFPAPPSRSVCVPWKARKVLLQGSLPSLLKVDLVAVCLVKQEEAIEIGHFFAHETSESLAAVRFWYWRPDFIHSPLIGPWPIAIFRREMNAEPYAVPRGKKKW